MLTQIASLFRKAIHCISEMLGTDQAGLNVHYRYYTGLASEGGTGLPTGPSGALRFAPAHFFAGLYDDAGTALSVPTYNVNGQLDESRDALGRVTRYLYSVNGLTETRINPLGGTFVTTYDTRGNITGTVNEIGALTATTYDANNNPTVITPECGCTRTQTYDTKGNVLTIRDSLGFTRTFTYNEFNQPTIVVDPLGRATQLQYDSRGNVKTITDALGQRSTLTHYSDGRTATLDLPGGRHLGFGYDSVASDAPSFDKPTGILLPDNTLLRMQYNVFGKPEQTVSALGHTNQFITDEAGKLLRRIDATGASFSYEYNADGTLKQVTDPLGKVTAFAYDAAYQLLSVTDGDGAQTRYQYDALGRMTNKIDAIGRATVMAYRADGVMTNTVQADGTRIGFEYDSSKRRTALIDPAGNRSEFKFNSRNELVEETDPLGKKKFYTYDSAGNLTRTTDRLGRVTVYEYDVLNRANRETWVSAGGVIEKVIASSYDEIGNLTAVEDEVVRLSYTYDVMNRVIQSQAQYGGEAPFVMSTSYDAAASSAVLSDGSGVSVEAVSDARGQLSRLLWQGGGVAPARVEMAYNALGDITELRRYSDVLGQQPVLKTEYQYGRTQRDNGFLSAMYGAMGSGDETVLSVYDKTESRGPLMVPLEDEEMMQGGYGALSRITALTQRDASGTQWGKDRYQYDGAGQLTNEFRELTTSGGMQRQKSFLRDLTGQLLSVLLATSAVATTTQEAYAYDVAGNRTSAVLAEVAQASVVGAGNRLLNQGAQSFLYDAEGNLVGKTNGVSGEQWSYQYDHRNRLTQATQRDGSGAELKSVSYSYDALNRRIGKSVAQTVAAASPTATVFVVKSVFYYDGPAIWLEETRTATATNRVHYLSGEDVDQWLARYRSTSSNSGAAGGSGPGEQVGQAWYVTDRMGTVQALVDASGAPIQQTEYDAYGSISRNTLLPATSGGAQGPGVEGAFRGDGSDPTQFGFTGREFDPETGFYFYRARYYDPALGRFLSEDPSPSTPATSTSPATSPITPPIGSIRGGCSQGRKMHF